MLMTFPTNMGIFTFVLGIALFVYLVKVFNKTPSDTNKLRELKNIMDRKRCGEQIYLDDLKYLNRNDLKKYLDAKFSDEK